MVVLGGSGFHELPWELGLLIGVQVEANSSDPRDDKVLIKVYGKVTASSFRSTLKMVTFLKLLTKNVEPIEHLSRSISKKKKETEEWGGRGEEGKGGGTHSSDTVGAATAQLFWHLDRRQQYLPGYHCFGLEIKECTPLIHLIFEEVTGDKENEQENEDEM